MSILAEIFAHKRAEVTHRQRLKPLPEMRAEAEAAAPPLDFYAALKRAAPRGIPGLRFPAVPALIAEVKLASPSRGILLRGCDPVSLARLYQVNGAAAISVLTDERYFQGHLDHLCQIAGLSPRLPLLRKDFLYDPYQVYEARAAGADAVLLIAAALPAGLLTELHSLAQHLGMAALVEVHSLEELQSAMECRPRLVGINNRDLRDFSVDLGTTLRLRPHVPAELCLVAESGIHTRADVIRLAEAGVDAILVGEALVTAPDIAARVRQLAGGGVRE